MSVGLYAKESADSKKRNAILREKKAKKLEEHTDKGIVEEQRSVEYVAIGIVRYLLNTHVSICHSAAIPRHHKTFTWENLNYHVPVPGKSLRLLHDINGYVKPGTLTALMGTLGSFSLIYIPKF